MIILIVERMTLNVLRFSRTHINKSLLANISADFNQRRKLSKFTSQLTSNILKKHLLCIMSR